VIAREERHLERKFGDVSRIQEAGASVGLITLLARDWQEHLGLTHDAKRYWLIAGSPATSASP
jgi:hypothetical protein